MRALLFILTAAALAACTNRPTATIQPPTAALTATTVPPTSTSASPTEPVVPTATAPPAETPVVVPAALFVVQQPDDEVALVTVDGQLLPLAEAPATVYALANLTGDVSAPQQVFALGPDGPQPLDFIEDVSYGIASWSDPASGEVRLAWDHYEVGAATGSLTSQILVGTLAQAGAWQVRESITETVTERVLRVVGWAPDGQRLFYSKEPLGLGGYILFSGVSDLWVYDWASEESTNVVPADAAGTICLDDYTEFVTQVAHHCAEGQISVIDLSLGMTSAILPPPEVIGDVGVMGRARFSPTEDRLAFSLARGDPANEQGWVAVSDSLAGPARIIATADPGDYFDVVDWLDPNTLILQSNGAAPGLWLVNADGTGLRRLADGRFLALVPAGP